MSRDLAAALLVIFITCYVGIFWKFFPSETTHTTYHQIPYCLPLGFTPARPCAELKKEINV